MSSLGPKKPRIDDDGSSSSPRPVVVASATTIELPLLTKTNYHEWSLVMQVSLEAMELWDAVEVVCKERAKDRWALAAILHAVPSEMKARLAVKKLAKEAWDAVKKMRVGDDRVKSASVQRLLKEFENVAFRNGESVNDFTMRINGLVASLCELGEPMEDSRVVKKILCMVPKKMKQVAVAIEMFMDFDTTSVEEVIGRLRVAEDADLEEVTNSVGRLYLIEEQWEARRRQCRGKEQASGDATRHGSNKKAVGRDGGHDENDDGVSIVSGSSRQSECRNRGKCFNFASVGTSQETALSRGGRGCC
ncbi:uncharacterized protein [Setaria viridis]|uniref:uncharacterized protein n=1 Tax=Setaria viridis TaxID=4556 RepID=UPI003B3B9239